MCGCSKVCPTVLLSVLRQPVSAETASLHHETRRRMSNQICRQKAI
jgi:hypothetical protein